MAIGLSREEIYDALVDDEVFARLPTRLAEAHSARSCVVHWRPRVGTGLIGVDNGYYSADALHHLAEHFPDDDIWSDAILAREHANRSWVCDDLVPHDTFVRSRLHNEWMRPNGDDTAHAMGIGLDDRDGTGCIGLHRAGAMGAFDNADRARFDRDVADISRVLRLRARMATTEADRQARSVLDRLSLACIVVDAQGRPIDLNESAIRACDSALGWRVAGGTIDHVDGATRQTLMRAIHKACLADGGRASAFLAPIPDGRRCAINVTPLLDQVGGRRALITFEPPLGAAIRPCALLRSAYGLSASEAAIAIDLAEGVAPSEIAERRGASVGTVRTQIKSIAAKLGCHRQVEIAVAVAQLRRVRAH